MLLSSKYTQVTIYPLRNISKQGGKTVDMTQLMPEWKKSATLAKVFPEMIDAIQCIRAEGIKTALLTNNWRFADGSTLSGRIDLDLFDVVSEIELCPRYILKSSRFYRSLNPAKLACANPINASTLTHSVCSKFSLRRPFFSTILE